MSWSSSVFRKSSVFDWYWLPSIFFRMIVRTMVFVAAIAETTTVNFVVQRMILLFFPTMSSSASVLVFTAVNCIILDESLHFPVLALFLVIIIEMWLPPIILPIVSIDTGITRVISVTVGTPYCFEVKHVEVWVFRFHLMQQIDSQFSFIMSKGAHITVFARIYFSRIARTKFDFIFFWVIKFFDSVVWAETLITHWAVLDLADSDIWTYFASINPKSSPFILGCFMIIEALLWIMRASKCAVLGFKVDKI